MKIKLSKSQWEKIGQSAGWNPEKTQKRIALREALEHLSRADKLLSISGERDLAMENIAFQNKIMDRINILNKELQQQDQSDSESGLS
jgi:hypothetical protein